MRLLILAGICLAVIGGVIVNTEIGEDLFSTTYTATKVATTTETKVERVVEKELDVRIAEALDRELPAIEEAAAEMQAEAEAAAKAEYEAALAAAASSSQTYIDEKTAEVTDTVKSQYIAEIEQTIGSEAYWTVSRVQRLLRRKAAEFGANYYVMNGIVSCESQYRVGVQSNHVYTTTNAPAGYRAGDREQSYGLAQIHVPVHADVTIGKATNPVFAAEWLAKKVATGQAKIWTCYHKYVANY